jgi:hypothetical protein
VRDEPDASGAGGLSPNLVTLNHRVPGSSPGAPTIQSYQTADFQAESKWAVSAGIFAGIFLLFRSPATFAVSQADLSHRSLHPKIPFRAGGVAATWALQEPGILGVLWPKRTFRTRSVLIAGSIRGLRTVGSILPEHHEVARLQCREANDLQPQRARDPAQGTLAKSSC